MTEKVVITPGLSHPDKLNLPEDPVSFIAQEYSRWQVMFSLQTNLIQRFIEAQASKLAESIVQSLLQIRFTLPDRVIVASPGREQDQTILQVPPEFREQMARGVMDRFTKTSLNAALRQRLDELDASSARLFLSAVD
jgi:hypothetical protein